MIIIDLETKPRVGGTPEKDIKINIIVIAKNCKLPKILISLKVTIVLVSKINNTAKKAKFR